MGFFKGILCPQTNEKQTPQSDWLYPVVNKRDNNQGAANVCGILVLLLWILKNRSRCLIMCHNMCFNTSVNLLWCLKSNIFANVWYSVIPGTFAGAYASCSPGLYMKNLPAKLRLNTLQWLSAICSLAAPRLTQAIRPVMGLLGLAECTYLHL